METMIMNETGVNEPVKTRKASIARKLMTAGMCLNAMAGATAITTATAFADTAGDEWAESVNITDSNGSATSIMGNVIGILLTITRYVGIALVVYGVYEVVMSFMQNQPEAKTKGIVMALAGAIMVGLKSVLQAMGVIGK